MSSIYIPSLTELLDKVKSQSQELTKAKEEIERLKLKIEPLEAIENWVIENHQDNPHVDELLKEVK